MSGGIGIKTSAAIVLMVLFTLFVLQNTEVVEISFIFWRVSLSRVLLLVGSLAIGCLAGMLIGWEIFSRRGRRS